MNWIYDNYILNPRDEEVDNFDLYVEQEYFLLSDEIQLELDNDSIKYDNWISKLKKDFDNLNS